MKLWLFISCLWIFSAPLHAACSDDILELRGDFGQARFSIELADDHDERAKGLMNRAELPRSAGMLFFYDKMGRPAFWMKNTLIPLDMIFIDPQGIVTRVHENAVPLDETPIDGGPGVIAVLEINGGLSSKLGIVPGVAVRHPRFGKSSIWPCE